MSEEKYPFIQVKNKKQIAYRRLEGRSPGVMFLGGFRSDMEGTKACSLELHCKAVGRSFLKFDYTGHGSSSGNFNDGTIGSWTDDAIAVLDEVSTGPQVLVGSSMGGWISILCALARPKKICGIVGVASAPDFTEELIWNQFSEEQRKEIQVEGSLNLNTEYSEDPHVITRDLIEEGRNHLVLGSDIPLRCPLRLIHGIQDFDVPWNFSEKLLNSFSGENVNLTLIKEGDHRLSRPQDIKLLIDTVETLCIEIEEPI
ncbi:MAG: alpha/beta hydrolase [Nitrospinota bacterium]|nr:alpha/beta hydrolase [Nitrospinota bacterium]